MGITLTEQHSSIDPKVRARAPKDIDNDGYLLVSKNKRETRTAFQIAFLIFRDTKTRKNVLTSICKSEERRIWKSPHSFHWQWGIKKVNPVPPTGEVFLPRLCCSLFHFYFPSLVASLPLTCSPLSPLRLTHTRTDLTISPIQPLKSNYHGQNRVIKSNGLLYEVHTHKQNKSFSTLIHNIPFVTYLVLPMINWLYSFGP